MRYFGSPQSDERWTTLSWVTFRVQNVSHLFPLIKTNDPRSFWQNFLIFLLTSSLYADDPSLLQINNTPERDNDVQAAADDEINSSNSIIPTTTSTSNTSTSGSPPFFTNSNSMFRLISKPSGNMVKLKCIAKGDPEPKVVWTRDGMPIDRKMGQVHTAKWSITLEDLIPDDSGAYMCNVCNIHGCIDFTTRVDVKGE